MRRAIALVAGVFAGVACAGILIVLSSASTSAARTAPLPRGVKITNSNNKQPLTRSERNALVRWARQYRACARQKGIALAKPSVHGNEVAIRASDGSKVRPAQMLRGQVCAARLGDPPPMTSFVLSGGSFHLYRPRACLLPVRKQAA